jgi:F420-dependent oxidoreductase-like protein
MDIGLMVEGQNGLTWERWRHILSLAERLGMPSVSRSDHYFARAPQDSLEAYLSFAVAAAQTRSLRFGPMVSPVTFRHPADLARMAAQLDLASGGRFTMGVGAGWNEPEHLAYGLPFPSTKERFDRLEEAIQVMRALWSATEPTSFEGRYYQLHDAEMLPRPRDGRPPLLIGGAGERRTLELVARYADEWNCLMLPPEKYAAKVRVLERHCEAEGRDPAAIRRSMMMFGAVGPTEESVFRSLRELGPMLTRREGVTVAELGERARARGAAVGNAEQAAETLGQLGELGVAEVQMQHIFFDEDDVPAYLAEEVAPLLAGA